MNMWTSFAAVVGGLVLFAVFYIVMYAGVYTPYVMETGQGGGPPVSTPVPNEQIPDESTCENLIVISPSNEQIVSSPLRVRVTVNNNDNQECAWSTFENIAGTATLLIEDSREIIAKTTLSQSPERLEGRVVYEGELKFGPVEKFRDLELVIQEVNFSNAQETDFAILRLSAS